MRSPLEDFLIADDPAIQRIVAERSQFVDLSRDHILANLARITAEPCGTSLLHSGANSLPAWTTSSTATSAPSVASSIGYRHVPNRFLDHQGNDILSVPEPVLPVTYECPFNHLNCLLIFDNIDEWYLHSLLHFGSAGPPQETSCPFCDRRAPFRAINAELAWRARMQHVADDHYAYGVRLATARPDFDMFRYLWKKRVIDEATLGELMGNRDGGRPPTAEGNGGRKRRSLSVSSTSSTTSLSMSASSPPLSSATPVSAQASTRRPSQRRPPAPSLMRRASGQGDIVTGAYTVTNDGRAQDRQRAREERRRVQEARFR
ncbi:hypothetical protein MMC25_006771 [Agyrium rufum]|nr:hypothetical protein [Agyrium rufum]